jgi:hypothetical protein
MRTLLYVGGGRSTAVLPLRFAAVDGCEYWPIEPALGFPGAGDVTGLPAALVVSVTGDPTHRTPVGSGSPRRWAVPSGPRPATGRAAACRGGRRSGSPS